MQASAGPGCDLDQDGQFHTLYLKGVWRLSSITASDHALQPLLVAEPARLITRIDGSGLDSVDTASALLLWRRLQSAGIDTAKIPLTGFTASHHRIIVGVLKRLSTTQDQPAARQLGSIALLGQNTLLARDRLKSHISYLGLTTAALGEVLIHPSRLRPKELFTQLQQTGLSAIPVISLVMFLIGAVMAYLLGLQAEQYGANIYVVDGVALGTVREFAPLLVATVVAGRSGASFTAQLGTMKLTEEIDAIRTLGLSPEQVLLLPRVAALVIVLPLLVFVGSVAALAGAAFICDQMLGITPDTFFERMRSALSIRHYLIGLFKAPVFAIVIAVIGCSMGLSVSRDTRSIGMNTTSTVVQCIVAVVLLDAVFAIIFQLIGW